MWLSLTAKLYDHGGGYTVEFINGLVGDKMIVWTRMILKVLAESALKRLKTPDKFVSTTKSLLEFKSAHATPVYLQ